MTELLTKLQSIGPLQMSYTGEISLSEKTISHVRYCSTHRLLHSEENIQFGFVLVSIF